MVHSAPIINTSKQVTTMRPRGDWLGRKEAAILLGIDDTTLHKYKAAGKLEGVVTKKFGAFTYYWRPSLLEFIAERDAAPDTDSENTTK